jgi:hypothetical protein
MFGLYGYGSFGEKRTIYVCIFIYIYIKVGVYTYLYVTTYIFMIY